MFGFLGKSEKELNEIAKSLEAQDLELKNRESVIKRNEDHLQHERDLLESDKSAFQKEQEAFREEVKQIRNQIAEEKANLEKSRQEFIRQEAQSKAGFAKMQEETFKEVVEKRMAQLDARQADLDNLSKRIEADLAKVIAKEGDVARRELAVTEQEQRADAGFADKATALASENKRQLEENHLLAKQLKEREEALAAKLKDFEMEKENLRKREQDIAEAERLRDAGYSDERSKLDNELNKLRVDYQNETARKRHDLLADLTKEKTEKLTALEAEIAEIREQRLKAIEISEEKERERIRKAANDEAESVHKDAEEYDAQTRKTAEEYAAQVRKTAEEEAERIRKSADQEAERVRKTAEDEANQMRSAVNKERSEWNEEREAQKAELKTQSEANEKKAGELSAKDDYLLNKEQNLKMREDNFQIQRNNFEETVEECIEERKKTLEKAYATIQEENDGLRNTIRDQMLIFNQFDQLKRQLNGDEPYKVKQELEAKVEEIRRLQEKLSKPPAEIQERLDELEKESKRYKEKAERLEDELEDYKDRAEMTNELRRKNDKLENDYKDLQQDKEAAEAEANKYKEKYERTLAANKNPQEKEDRYKAIEAVRIPADKTVQLIDLAQIKDLKPKSLDEMEWLTNIYNQCKEHEIYFPWRILKAFHTAVKTAEWSPITILAGVSGTGKSELPRLYSHFGGLFFQPLTVQPNWDSQESMLGFFNSIDNHFDAQPVLKFLARSQKPYSDDYPGLKEAVCMVLLDEMNLAHPELYFADFLSKLEQRREFKDELPNLEVKVGARIDPYLLPLGRNVLWTGTMNQDETTKSLSDKVLDRSIIIYFPRPTELKPRRELKELNEKNRGKILHISDFQKWIVNNTADIFKDERLILPYRRFVEKINNYLGKANRAVGHRVWQSIEYYMANYPDVRLNVNNETKLKKAIHKAFEDQLVQKVMPKLRGIETRGNSTTKKECIEPIRNLLVNGVNDKNFKNLLDDFELACELGHGQFIWTSANYINKEEGE